MLEKRFDLAWNLYVELRKEIVGVQRLRIQLIGFKIAFVSSSIGIIYANKDRISENLFFIPAFVSI
jgi:hypothetical protein